MCTENSTRKDAPQQPAAAEVVDPTDEVAAGAESSGSTSGKRKRNRDDMETRPLKGRDGSLEAFWTLKLPRPLVVLMHDLCEHLQVEHFITSRALMRGTTIDMGAQWTIEASDEKHLVLPRWMHTPALLQLETAGELMVTMHTHPRAAVTKALDWVSNRRQRHLHAKTNPLLYVPSEADVNNMLRYGMHVHIVVTPFHWFVCHVTRPSEPTQLKWDMRTLLDESKHKTVADWAATMNARCDHFAVVLLSCESLNLDYGSTDSNVPWIRYDSTHMWLEIDFAKVKAAAVENQSAKQPTPEAVAKGVTTAATTTTGAPDEREQASVQPADADAAAAATAAHPAANTKVDATPNDAAGHAAADTAAAATNAGNAAEEPKADIASTQSSSQPPVERGDVQDHITTSAHPKRGREMEPTHSASKAASSNNSTTTHQPEPQCHTHSSLPPVTTRSRTL